MEAADLSHHTSRRFNEDLERVRAKVSAMGGFVEEQLDRALTALVAGDSALGQSVATQDYKVNGMEVSIDEECSRILATRAPAAGDLRMIVATIKAITDLERIGDECEKIALIAARLATDRLDADLAVRTARSDRIVDEEYESIQRQCITFMMEDPRMIRRALDVMWVVRSLERIGDHAKNVCEYVIYMVHGKDVRHRSLERVEQELKSQNPRD